MDTSVHRLCIASVAAASAVTLTLLVGLAFGSASAWGAAPGGRACQSSDGKISGRGATYQDDLEAAFIAGYNQDFCGNVAEQFSGDPAGTNMIAYNYPKAVAANATGAGAGLSAASCRTDAYAGSSLPYSEAQLLELTELRTRSVGVGSPLNRRSSRTRRRSPTATISRPPLWRCRSAAPL